MNKQFNVAAWTILIGAAAFCWFAGSQTAPAQTHGATRPANARSATAAPQAIVGWRNDGTGHFPSANPPTAWSRTLANGKPESSGILWMTPVPSGASAPIIVGDRIFFGFDDYGLMCVSKTTGRYLWFHTHHYYEAMSDDERKTIEGQAGPAYAKISSHLIAEFQRMSNSVSVAGFPADKRFMSWDWGHEIADQQKQLDAAVLTVDSEKYKNPHQPWEWASATPVSDGKFVYMWFSHRVAVCYDLDGNRQWLTIEPTAAIKGDDEHGRHSSPVLAGDNFIVQYGREIIAFDRKTGKVVWTQPMTKTPFWCDPVYSSLVVATAAGQPYVVTCMGEGFRASDGERGWGPHKDYAGENTSAIVVNDRIFVSDRKGLFQLQIPASPGPNAQAAVIKSDSWKGYMVASPLYVDGLVYVVDNEGMMQVYDAEAGGMVYQQQLPLNAHKEYVYFPGIAASPALAGKYIYIMDNQGGTLILEPGRTFKQVAINTLQTPEKTAKEKDGKSTQVYEQTVSNPIFDGKTMIIRGQQYLYCIGKE